MTPRTPRDKARARGGSAVTYALHLGWISFSKPLRCQICGQVRRLHAHHPDYERPTEVMWLCPRCHGFIHRLSRKLGTLDELEAAFSRPVNGQKP
jgi:hypothetical protein